MSTNTADSFRNTDRHQDRRQFLITRNAITAATRAWFEARRFIEVETAALQVSPGNETHLHGLATTVTGPDGESTRRYLHTSPEFAMKKLLAAGETRIYTLARVFRDREHTALHATEFTMLEWYRTEADYRLIMDDTIDIMRAGAEAAGARHAAWAGRTADPFAEAELLTVGEAFAHYAKIDLGDVADDRGAFAKAATGAGIRVADDDTWSDIFSRVLVEKIEPRLGRGRPTLLYDYPVSEAALARTRPGPPAVAERFELYLCGVELANGFSELTDADEQRRRFTIAMDDKERIYGERTPIDEDFLAALAHMPPASGVALGFDRLVMLATGAPSVHHVMWTPAKPGGPQ